MNSDKDFEERKRKGRGCIPKILIVTGALVVAWLVVIPRVDWDAVWPRASPGTWLTYEVDLAHAYDGAPRNEAALVEGARRTLEQRARAFVGRNAVVTTRGREVVVALPRLEAGALRELEAVLEQGGRLELDVVSDSRALFAGAADDPEEGLTFHTEEEPDGLDLGGQPKTVSSTYATFALGPEKHKGETLSACRARVTTWLATQPPPPDCQVVLQALEEPGPGGARIPRGWRTLLVARPPALTNKDILDAVTAQDTLERRYYVAVTLTAEAAPRLEALTGENLQRRLAIVIDGVVQSAPIIKSKIAGGKVSITMGAGPEEEQLKGARQMEVALRVGALPAPVRRVRVEVAEGTGRREAEGGR